MSATIIKFPMQGGPLDDEMLVPSAEDLDRAPLLEGRFRKPIGSGYYQLFEWVDGSSTMTSTVMAIDLDDGWVRVIGRWYRLGRVCGAT